MNSKLVILLIAHLLLISRCTQVPDILKDAIIDLSYSDLKQQYISCNGNGVMSAKGSLPWKLNYSFTTQNDSSFIQFRDILGRRVLFVQALPTEITIWDMQKNIKYNSDLGSTIPIFNILESYDIAQILWGEIPDSYLASIQESGFETHSNLVNFQSSKTQLGMVLDKVIFNLDSIDTIVDFKILERDYGESNIELLKGIPEEIPLN